MPSAEFTRICRELYTLNETVNIDTKKGYIKFSVKSENVGGSIKIEENDNEDPNSTVTVKVQEDVCLDFALRYLNMFTKASTLSQQVILSLHLEIPLMVEYQLTDLGTLKFYLAPRIADEN